MNSTTTTIQGISVIEDSDDLPDTAPAIVMVHGWPDTHHLWDGQVAALRSRFRCVRFTLPGFDIALPSRPTSMAQMTELIGQVVQHAGRGQPVTLLLHDWGCHFGYQYALARPETVTRLIGVDVGDTASPAFKRGLTGKAKLLIAGYQLWLTAAWRLGGSLGDGMTRFMARALRCKSEQGRITAQMNYPYDMHWTGSYGGFRGLKPLAPTFPMLFIYGTRKPFLFHTPAWAEALAAKPGSAVLGLRTGHWVMVDQPAAFNQALLDWLGGANTARPAA